jgi:hypothetical protein
MNSTPANSNARLTAASFAAVSEVSPAANSARLIVFTPMIASRARSSALQHKSAWQLEFGRL